MNGFFRSVREDIGTPNPPLRFALLYDHQTTTLDLTSMGIAYR
jgi:hypothetical protein